MQERLDPRARERVNGIAWEPVRPNFERINQALLSVSPTATGEFVSQYVKYGEVGGQPYGVLWLKKAREMVLGLALPESVESTSFVEEPKGCRYARLTKYLVIGSDEVPAEIEKWAKLAYDELQG